MAGDEQIIGPNDLALARKINADRRRMEGGLSIKFEHGQRFDKGIDDRPVGLGRSRLCSPHVEFVEHNGGKAERILFALQTITDGGWPIAQRTNAQIGIQ
jgi:hypothetical protein